MYMPPYSQPYPPPFPPPYPPPRQRNYTLALVCGILFLVLGFVAIICVVVAINYAQAPDLVQIACGLGDPSSCQQIRTDFWIHAGGIVGALLFGVLAVVFGIISLLGAFLDH